ncbi:hypothetical protein BH20CHL6_BH20CHL6_03780 [soil metagenome]
MTEQRSASGPVILCVEDEVANRMLLRAVLSRAHDRELAGATLFEAATIAEARAVLADTRVDVVLLDVRLPDGDGLTLGSELRSRTEAERPIVVILSASVLPTEREHALASEGDLFVGKPYRPAELLQTLAGVLRARSERQGRSG